MSINVASKIDKSCLNKIYLPQTFMNFASIIYRYCQRATCYSNSCILCLGVVSISYLGALMVAPVDPIKVKYIGRDHLSEMNTESFPGKTFWQADYPRWIHSSAVWKTINTDKVEASCSSYENGIPRRKGWRHQKERWETAVYRIARWSKELHSVTFSTTLDEKETSNPLKLYFVQRHRITALPFLPTQLQLKRSVKQKSRFWQLGKQMLTCSWGK